MLASHLGRMLIPLCMSIVHACMSCACAFVLCLQVRERGWCAQPASSHSSSSLYRGRRGQGHGSFDARENSFGTRRKIRRVPRAHCLSGGWETEWL